MALISAVIPAYKEPNILEFRSRLVRALAHYDYEIIWCLGDPQTLVMIGDASAQNLREKIVYRTDRGLGLALQSGFQHIDPSAEWVLTMDSDGQQDPAEIPRFIGSATCTSKHCKWIGADCIAGSYDTVDERSHWRKIISGLATRAIVWRHGLGLKNITSDYRLYRATCLRDVMQRNPPHGDDFEFVPEVLVRLAQLGYRNFANLDVSFIKRRAGSSHARLPARGYLGLLR